MRPASSVFPILLILLAMLSLITLRSIDPTFAFNQLLFFVGAFGLYILASLIPWFWVKKGTWLWYGLTLVLLLITLIIGRASHGAVSWIRLGTYRLQPSEFLKPALMLSLAVLVQKFPPRRGKNLLKFGLVAGLPLLLVMLQPDLGTTLVTVAGVIALLLAAKPRWQILALITGGAVTVAVLAWLFLFKPYQKDRILSFMDPANDPRGRGYNAQQAVIAVGSGGLTGRGFGKGLQSHLRFLPERQTDFLFATYAEEAGLVGCLFLIALYTMLFVFIAHRISLSNSPVKTLFAVGVLTTLLAQTAINIGMNIGIAPITGVTLPLFSLGGSSVAATALTLGLLESARRSSLVTTPRVE